jgi:hypothetical protein
LAEDKTMAPKEAAAKKITIRSRFLKNIYRIINAKNIKKDVFIANSFMLWVTVFAKDRSLEIRP